MSLSMKEDTPLWGNSSGRRSGRNNRQTAEGETTLGQSNWTSFGENEDRGYQGSGRGDEGFRNRSTGGLADIDEPGSSVTLSSTSMDSQSKPRTKKKKKKHQDEKSGHYSNGHHKDHANGGTLYDSLGVPKYGSNGHGPGPGADDYLDDQPGGICGTNTFVYCSHFLSAWGDQMWTFAVGLYLVIIMPDSLRLTAIFGLSMGVSVLLLGPILGDWVDNTARLKAAQVTLVLQNVLVVLCAVVIYAFLVFREELEDFGGWTEYMAYTLMIFFATCANLATIANTIAVQRDWIVEICGRDEKRLAKMTAIMRGIDLTTQVIAPIATGQIMTYAGDEFGCVFIASWNVCSVVVEYFLIWRVYNTVPALRKKKDMSQRQTNELAKEKDEDKEDLLKQNSFTASFQRSLTSSRSNNLHVGGHKATKDGEKGGTEGEHPLERSRARSDSDGDEPMKNGCSSRWRIFSGITIIVEGWKTYARYKVMLSGVALCMLFMTVLGFHNVTVGYAQLQGLSESVIGLMMGAAGTCGILGTMMYPLMHRWFGLPRTGLMALTCQTLCLVACVVSVFLPGSPFDLTKGDDPDPVNCTNLTNLFPSHNMSDPTTLAPGILTIQPVNITCPEPEAASKVSVYVLMAGIISARFGLWIADLAITQMFMETVIESERGVVNGVQNSMNQMMEMIKYGLVVALPMTTQFGLLVFLSFTFVFGGWFMYCIFLVRLPSGIFSKGSCGGPKYERI